MPVRRTSDGTGTLVVVTSRCSTRQCTATAAEIAAHAVQRAECRAWLGNDTGLIGRHPCDVV